MMVVTTEVQLHFLCTALLYVVVQKVVNLLSTVFSYWLLIPLLHFIQINAHLVVYEYLVEVHLNISMCEKVQLFSPNAGCYIRKIWPMAD